MSLFRLLAIDLDGTLLLPDGSVSPRNRRALDLVRQVGYEVVLATGRNFTESRRILEAVAFAGLAVFVSGAIVMDTRTGQVLRRIAMDSALAREAAAAIEDLGHAALALQDRDIAGTDYLATDGVALDQATRQWMSVTSARIVRPGRLAEHAHPCTLRVGLVAHRDHTAAIEAALRRRLGEQVIIHSLFVPAYEVEVLEVFDPAVSKWEAIRHIAVQKGVAPEQIVAVGDDVNDISMLRGAGLGAAMGNAKPAVKAAAGRILRPNTEDGLAEFLEELAKKHPAAQAAGTGGDLAA